MALTDELRIDTPEQIALELPIAGIGSRFLAIAIDTVLQVLTYIALVIVLILAGPWISRRLVGVPQALQSFWPALLVFFSFCLYWGYFAAFEIFWKGLTPGKRIAGIRVIKDTGRPADVMSVILRNLLRAIDFMPAFYAAGIVSMVLNRHSRRLGDLVAGTVVVHDKPPARMEAEWLTVAPDTSAPTLANPQVARLTDSELVLIETYLQRRLEVDWEHRERTRAQIAERVTGRTGLTPEAGQSVDDFLETVARQARDTARLR